MSRDKTVLSETMRDALEGARQHNAVLVREPGGFWTYPNCGHSRGAVPDWYVGTTTINALIAREAVRVTETKRGRGGEFPVRVELVVKPVTENA